MNIEIQALQERIEHLETRCEQSERRGEQLEQRGEQSEHRYLKAERRLKTQAGLAFLVVIGAILISPANRGAIAQGYGTTLQLLLVRTQALENKTQFVAVSGGEMYVKGTNLHIDNGLPDPGTDVNGAPIPPTLNGEGNLIIGFNESRVFSPDIRTGSHNLIIGAQNNYSSFGGLVAGRFNSISGQFASISGGVSNTASGSFASVSGGQSNRAIGLISSVSGGFSNSASVLVSSVSGGQFNTASGISSSVSGGEFNTASGSSSSVSGGRFKTATGGYDFLGNWDGVGPTWAAVGFNGH